MASDSKKSNQAAGEGKKYCRRVHWLAVLGTMETLTIPPEWLRGALVGDWWVDLTVSSGNLRDWLRITMECQCIDCQRHPRRSEDGNPHEGKVMA